MQVKRNGLEKRKSPTDAECLVAGEERKVSVNIGAAQSIDS